jgi:hypothetical protein
MVRANFEPLDGSVWVSTAARPVAQPWVDQLLTSIEWLP